MAFDTSQEAYIELRNIIVERTGGIVFWTGSGLSAQAGLPTWVGLKNELLNALRQKIERSDSPESKESDQRAARQIEQEGNNWRAFERLKTHLGQTTYRTRIRNILNPSSSMEPPPIYEKIWRLKPHGMLTLNIDRLATKAYQQTSATKTLITEFVGNQVGQLLPCLEEPSPILVQSPRSC